MKDIKIGVSRIFNARGFEIVGGEEIKFEYLFNDIKVIVYIGPNLQHPIFGMTWGPHQPKDPAIKKDSRENPISVPDPKVFPADVYCEIIASRNLSVADDFAVRYYEKEKEAIAEVEKIAFEYKSKFTSCLDFVAGLIGIQLSSYLIRTLIIEQSYLYFKDKVRIAVNSNFTVYKPYRLDLAGDWKLTAENKVNGGFFNEEWKMKTEVLTWLLRAWSAEDVILRFVSLFIPLEKIIPIRFPEDQNNIWKTERRKVEELVTEYASSEDHSQLTQFVKNLRPNLKTQDKFRIWAGKIKLTDWEKDIENFQKLKRIRDRLIHGGTPPDEFNNKLFGADLLTLESLAKKYISFWLLNA